ncbi:MAG: prepilin-type N-terminal cleavage/methylation domain-containing protein [Phycisphaerales bacterium]|nr:MAG: prepilin-type N-terminal cleavage/methylation domain-containing protein [Phycisphaerales bacterium]
MFESKNLIPHHRRRALRQARRGFSLLEIVVVVTIIALLATLVAPRLLDNIGRSKQGVARSEVASIAQQVNLYLADHGLSRIPQDFRLEALTEGDRPYMRERDLIDPWGNPYVIVIPGEENIDFDIVSYGADGQPGGEGEDQDIVN